MKSIMHNKQAHTCYLCMYLHSDYMTRTRLEEHHVFGGFNRKLSEKYGLKIYLCHEHHNDPFCPESIHHNKTIKHDIQRIAQRKFMTAYPDKDFISIFGKNYI